MTTQTRTIFGSTATSIPGETLLPWISRGLEGLWLLAAFLVPIMFLDQDYAISEAQISYVEVPKVALLRILAGLIAVLWSIEWAIKGNRLQTSFSPISLSTIVGKLNPLKSAIAINRWVKVHTIRWLILAAGLFFGSTVLSTVLSGSFHNSMWGEIPGQDGYSAYTIFSYAILFGVISTHLKSPAQLSRLLSAVVFMGTLVGTYGIFQHYNHDFLNLTESTGGGSDRVTIFMGNTIFAAAVLTTTVPITLIAATIHFQNEIKKRFAPFSRLSQLQAETLATLLWALILTVQLLGLMFTFSRGPWIGTALALAAFLGLILISLGWRMLIRSGLVLGLASVFCIGFLHWQGNISVINVGPWLGFVLALLGLIVTFAVLFLINRFRRAVVFIAVVAAVAAISVAVVVAPAALKERGNFDIVAANEVVGNRILSIKSEVMTGAFGGRTKHWEESWKLIKNRPWFEFDNLSLPWLRPVIGYGPDLFRYTYLLESQPDGKLLLPLEPDHAHNFFIHQTVEQGFLGGLASLALFASVFGVTVHKLVFRRKSGNPIYRILFVGAAAVILGRFLEMSVGVARISDLTVLWVIFGLFAASFRFEGPLQENDSNANTDKPQTNVSSRKNRGRNHKTSAVHSFGIGLLFRLMIVTWLIGGLGVVTWQKSINSVRASVAEGKAIKHFTSGDFEKSIEQFDHAIRLAPGVPSYYSNRDKVFLAYSVHPEVSPEPGCKQQTENPYQVCLALESIYSNLESVNQQPFHYLSRVSAGNSAFNLRLNEAALEQYSIAASMVPNSYSLRYDLAESLIDASSYSDALANLEYSLSITGETDYANRGLMLKGRALYELGRLDEAEETWKLVSFLSLDSLYQINVDRGVTLDIEYFDHVLEKDPEDSSATYFRGLAHLARGELNSAIIDFTNSLTLGFGDRWELEQVKGTLGYANFMAGGDPKDLELSVNDLIEAANLNPKNPLFHAYLGDVFLSRGSIPLALNAAETADTIDSNHGVATLVTAMSFMSLGLENNAKAVLNLNSDIDLVNAKNYVNRGNIFTQLGQYDMALSDFNEAIRINSEKAMHYNARAQLHAIMGDFYLALEDFTSAIKRNPAEGQFFRNRGVLYGIYGDSERSATDFRLAKSLDGISNPQFNEIEPSYYLTYSHLAPSRFKPNVNLKLMTENLLQEIIGNSEYESDLQGIGWPFKTSTKQFEATIKSLIGTGKSFFALGMWESAAAEFSRLIESYSEEERSVTVRLGQPHIAELYKLRGDSFLALKHYGDAVSDYNQAIRLANNESRNFVARGKALADMGEFELAKNDFTVGIQIDPNSSEAYKSRGYLFVQSGESSQAFTDLNRAIEINPLDNEAYFYRAKAHIDLEQPPSALKDLDKAILLAPTNSDYFYNRGLLQVELGDFESALKNFDDAISVIYAPKQTNKRYGRLFVDRARLHLQLNNLTKAQEDVNNGINKMQKDLDSTAWIADQPAIKLELAEARLLLDHLDTRLGENRKAQ